MPEQEDFAPIVAAGALEQLRAVYSDRTFEIKEPILAGEERFATIRIGVSPLLVRPELQAALRTAAGTVVAVLAISMLVAMLLAQWMLRPIHVIQSGLSRLGRGELDVRLDLPEGGEFKDLGSSFEAVSAQIAALGKANSSEPSDPHTVRPGGNADFESVMENLEDAVALFSPTGEPIFNNAAMRALEIPSLPALHPARQLVERTLAGRKSQGPVSVTFPGAAVRPHDRTGESASHETPEAERMLMSHAIEDTTGRFLGAMLVARNLGYLTQVHSTLNYSRKLAALGRLMAGVAHEVKNPAERDDDSPRAAETEARRRTRGRDRAGGSWRDRSRRRSVETRQHHRRARSGGSTKSSTGS